MPSRGRKKSIDIDPESLTDEELMAIAAMDGKGGDPSGKEEAQAATVLIPEVIPTDPRNPAFRERVIIAIVKSAGDVEKALQSIGCSWEVYKQVTDHSDWDKEVERTHHRMVVQPLLAAGKAAVMQKVVEEGNAYSLKMLYDTAPKEKLNEEDAAYLDSMAGAPRNILLREANKLAKEAANLIESLEGGKRPSKQLTDEIVRAVSERPRKPKKITA